MLRLFITNYEKYGNATIGAIKRIKRKPENILMIRERHAIAEISHAARGLRVITANRRGQGGHISSRTTMLSKIHNTRQRSDGNFTYRPFISRQFTARPFISRQFTARPFTASGHSITEIIKAYRLYRPEFYVLSPVFATASHPEQKPLGLLRTFKIINSAPRECKFILLGGMNDERYKRLKVLDSGGMNGSVVGFAGIDFWM